jgi:hypothetical protein
MNRGRLIKFGVVTGCAVVGVFVAALFFMQAIFGRSPRIDGNRYTTALRQYARLFPEA